MSHEWFQENVLTVKTVRILYSFVRVSDVVEVVDVSDFNQPYVQYEQGFCPPRMGFFSYVVVPDFSVFHGSRFFLRMN